MKRKYADHPNWNRVKEKEYFNRYFDTEEFKGNISLLTAIKVKEKLVVLKEEKEITILDDNFKWLEIYPEDNKNIAISVSIDDKNEIIEWYFDIAKDFGLTEKGVPYIDDLYLDVTLYKNGKITLLDEDELQDALENEEITKEDFELAYNVAKKLISKIEGKVEQLKKFTYKYFYLMQEN